MSDSGHLGPSEWVQLVGGGLISGIGGAMAWFRSLHRSILERIAGVETRLSDEVECMTEDINRQKTSVAVLQAQHQNHCDELKAIREDIGESSVKMDRLQATLTEVLITLKKGRT